ncbi:MAG: hypothetical protein R3F53_06415 [Gammaproteobacteria bacterium]
MTVINALKTLGMTILLGALIMGLSGCPASLSGSAYSRNQARTLQTVETGTVESVRQVFIEGTKTGLGGASGAALGGLAASNIGGGRGQVAATIGGALIGGVAGAAAEEAMTRQPGLEIIVRLDSGRTVAVTQAADEPFRPGERVRILYDYDTARVTH